MTKKDYVLIARIFNKNITSKGERENAPIWKTTTVNEAVAKQFAEVLGNENPKFDHSKFLSACGITK